jgi:GntR family transcriptional repressor for pyruvate dehydrogenase complex
MEIRDDGPGPFEILEARRVIEAETAALAAARITPGQLAALEAAFDEMAQEDANGSVSEAADRNFHCLVAQASQNSALASAVSWLWELRNRSGISVHFHRRVREEGVHPSLEHHRRILAAIRNRDPLAAQKAMVDHLSDVITQNTDWLDRS